jgi:pimeloyl-ACP methyl ester carboxylesterase
MLRSTFIGLCAGVLFITVPNGAQAQSALPVRFDSVDVNGIKLVYRTAGSGDPLILLHGFSGTGEAWTPFVADLAASYTLIIPDLRGHGRSTNPGGRFTHRQSALDIFGLLDRLGIQRFRAMGISTGGMTLLHMATSQPERVEAMVLIGATSYFPEQARQIMRSNHPDSVPQTRIDALTRQHSRGAEQARELLTQFNAFKDSYDDMNFTPPLLATIKARTLILHGDRDAFFPVSIPVEEYAAIPRSYLWIIPNGSHVPFPRTDVGRRAFVETFNAFLKGDWR